MTLYTYCLRYDDGAAPNPYWNVCSLAICKPAIRRTANVGDWIVGLGSRNTDCGDLSDSVIYAMRVSTVLPMRDYDRYCRESLPQKIPLWDSTDFRRRVGDCIYDYSRRGKPSIRKSVHDEGNRKTDLGGKNVLLSDYFYYFGRDAAQLPDHLLGIRHRTQGHKSRANDSYENAFVQWIDTLGRPRNLVVGEPQLKELILNLNQSECRAKCASRDREEDSADREIC